MRLDELLAANQALMTVYVLRDDLKELWRLRDTEAARAAWQAWLSRATESPPTSVCQSVFGARQLVSEKTLAGSLPGGPRRNQVGDFFKKGFQFGVICLRHTSLNR